MKQTRNLKLTIKNEAENDLFINTKEIYEVFQNPFFCKRVLRKFKNYLNSNLDLWNISNFCFFFINSLEKASAEELENHPEQMYFLPQDAALMLLKSFIANDYKNWENSGRRIIKWQ